MFYLSDIFNDDYFTAYANSGSYKWKKTENGVRLLIELPGVRREALSVEAETDGTLKIVAKRDGDWGRSFDLSIRLGSRLDAEAAKAQLVDGFLTVDIPSASKKRLIQIV